MAILYTNMKISSKIRCKINRGGKGYVIGNNVERWKKNVEEQVMVAY